MSELYSRKLNPPPDVLRYDVDGKTRLRIIHHLSDAVRLRVVGGFNAFLDIMHGPLLREYGSLSEPDVEMDGHPVANHFLHCSDEHALDFIELTFRSHNVPPAIPSQINWTTGFPVKPVIDGINNVFWEEGVGYELTQFVLNPPRVTYPNYPAQTSAPKIPAGARLVPAARRPVQNAPGTGMLSPADILPTVRAYPQIIRRSDQYAHDQIIRPALEVLADPALTVANEEMLKAHRELREGKWDDAITDCCACFESVLKTICQRKGWPFDPGRDTCSRLVGICQANGLFPAFYKSAFEAVGTVRNRIGDAHGRASTPHAPPGQREAEHMLQMTSAHIIFLAKLAGF